MPKPSHPLALPVALVLSALVVAPVAAQGKPRLAVLGFQNNSTWTSWGDNLGKAAADELTTQLVKTGDFTVIERTQIDAVLAEQHLDMSGAVDPATAAKVGKILGAQAVLLGSITKFSIDRKSAGVGPFAATFAEAESSLDVRVVNTTTSEIMAVADGSGTKHFGGAAYKDVNFERTFDAGMAQEALRPAVASAIQQIDKQKAKLAAMPAPVSGNVVGARNGEVYIDQGQNVGVKVGQRYDVMRVVDQIKDANGNVLDNVTDKVGVIEVVRVLSQSSICKVVDGKAAPGDKLKGASGG
jgi:curli biogenesis system outer membrane secretion channel CsgG